MHEELARLNLALVTTAVDADADRDFHGVTSRRGRIIHPAHNSQLKTHHFTCGVMSGES
jgi:hypothetical protein